MRHRVGTGLTDRRFSRSDIFSEGSNSRLLVSAATSASYPEPSPTERERR